LFTQRKRIFRNPTSALLEVAADNKLRVEVNGFVVLDQFDQNNYVGPQTVDILSRLNLTGENKIEFIVRNDGDDGKSKLQNPAGVLFRLDIEGDVNSCATTTEPEPELPPVTSCAYVSDLALNTTPTQGNVAGTLTSFALNGNSYTTGDEFDLFATTDTSAVGSFQDEVVMERTADGLRLFFYGTGVNGGPVTEFSGSFQLNGVDLSGVSIEADSQPNEATGAWPDEFAIDASGLVTFKLYTNSGNDSFVISALSNNCDVVTPDTFRIFGTSYLGTGTDNPNPGQSIILESTSFSTTTDQNGEYYFDVVPGDYEVEKIITGNQTHIRAEENGTPVPPKRQTCVFSVVATKSTYQCDFFNSQDDGGTGENDDFYTISGFKYIDTNGNGVLDQGETGAAGWTITASDRRGDSANQTTLTGDDGSYSLTVPAGDWEVSEEDRGEDWTQTAVFQNGTVVSTESGMGTCSFNLNDDVSDTNANCNFLNQDNTPTDGENGGGGIIDNGSSQTTTSGGSSSGGIPQARFLTNVGPTEQVLGAATSVNMCPFLGDFMQIGVENDQMEVMKLQAFLNIFRTVFGGTAQDMTGEFDATTDANVKAFQRHFAGEILIPWYERGIVPHKQATGFVYKTTLWKINSIVCPEYAVTPDFTGEDLKTNVNKSRDF